MENKAAGLVPKEGHFVLHLFYAIDRVAWRGLGYAGQKEGREKLEQVIAEGKAHGIQVATMAMIARADMGFFLIGPELHALQAMEKRLAHALGAGVLKAVFTFFSLSERSEYTITEEEKRDELMAKEGLAAGSPELEAKMTAFRAQLEHYTTLRIYPKIPDWEFFCFYPMLKRRAVGQNWYALDYDDRKRLMTGHAAVGRKYSGRVQQIITGCTGLDDWEWGVTLFAHDPYEIRSIVYEMRFDEVSAQYGEFGEFYSGVPLALPALFERLDIAA